MLAISFDSYPVPGKSQIIRVSDLQPALVYTLSETYGGTYEVGASKTKLTGAAIQDMARK